MIRRSLISFSMSSKTVCELTLLWALSFTSAEGQGISSGLNQQKAKQGDSFLLGRSSLLKIVGVYNSVMCHLRSSYVSDNLSFSIAPGVEQVGEWILTFALLL